MVVAEAIDRIQRKLVGRRSALSSTNGAVFLQSYGQRTGKPSCRRPSDAMRSESVRRRRPPSAAFRILFVGLLRPEKGVDVLLDAYE